MSQTMSAIKWLCFVAALLFLAVPRRTVWQPAEPDPADWRPAAGGWHELTPNLSWAEGEDIVE